jgi:hypothetical protein
VRNSIRGTEALSANDSSSKLLRSQIENLADAIAIGGDVPVLVQRLTKAHQRRQGLVEMLGRQITDSPAPTRELTNRGAPRAASAETLACTAREARRRGASRAARAAQEPIKFTPIIEDARRGYQFAGALDAAVLLGICEVQVSGVPGRNTLFVTAPSIGFSQEIFLSAAA